MLASPPLSAAQLALKAAVGGAALGVVEPAPFVEIADHVGDVDAEHTQAGAGGRGMGVDDGNARVEQCTVFFV